MPECHDMIIKQASVYVHIHFMNIGKIHKMYAYT